tara:strand:+ start:465 stop:707 length:243 start_codon:yes stop_codon:yes gene_type:complete
MDRDIKELYSSKRDYLTRRAVGVLLGEETLEVFSKSIIHEAQDLAITDAMRDPDNRLNEKDLANSRLFYTAMLRANLGMQ